MKISQVLILLLSIILVNSRININLHRTITHDEQDKINNLNKEFSHHNSLSGYLKMKKSSAKFLNKNRENLRSKWDEYQRKIKKFESISSGNPVPDVIYNFAYGANVTLGTPPQTFSVGLDTGSSDLWVAGFDPSQSSTFVNLNKKYSRAYGQGSGSGQTFYTGFICEETVGFAGFTIENYKFGNVTEIGGLPVPGEQTGGSGGLLGLSTIDISFTGATPITQQFYNQGLIEKPQFSLYLNNTNSQLLIFGEVDPKYYVGEINYFDLAIVSWWEIRISGFEVYGELLPYEFGFLDTGTSGYVAPVEYVKNLNNILNSNFSDPHASLVIQDKKFPVYNGIYKWIPAKVNFIVIGFPFLELYYTVFDYENSRVGIANVNQNISNN